MNTQDRNAPMINGVGAACDMRQRTPGDIAEQLERDATSLAMTGQSFEKDKAFYDHVVANIREAAAFLAGWESVLQTMRRNQAIAIVNVRGAVWSDAVLTANQIRDAIGRPVGDTAFGWMHGTQAIVGALVARRNAVTVAKREGSLDVDLDAAKRDLIERARTVGRVAACGARIDGSGNRCTAPAGHDGPHRCLAADIDDRQAVRS